MRSWHVQGFYFCYHGAGNVKCALLTTTFAKLRDSFLSHLIVTSLKYLSGLLEGFETLPACFGRT
jgi:hypothetical protein